MKRHRYRPSLKTRRNNQRQAREAALGQSLGFTKLKMFDRWLSEEGPRIVEWIWGVMYANARAAIAALEETKGVGACQLRSISSSRTR